MRTYHANLLNSLTLVRCRPGGVGWLLILLLAAMGAFCMTAPLWDSSLLVPPRKSELAIPLGIGVAFLIGSLIVLYFQLRMEIRATEMGLHWCFGRGGKSARWDEVTDFYEKRLQKGQKASVIETPAGNITVPYSAWTNGKALREVVAQRAKSALNTEWAERGARPHERWPLVFEYNTPENRQMRGVALLLGPASLLMAAWFVADKWEKMARDFSLLGWKWGLLTVAAPLFLFLLLILMPALLLFVPFRAIRGRLSQRIAATADGLTFEDGAQRVEIAWNDIGFVYSEAAPGLSGYTRHVVVGRQGQFDFTGYLKDYRILDNLIARLAPEAVERGRDFSRDFEDLAPPKETDTIGEHIYHYRTRSNRALLWMAATPALGGIVMALLTKTGMTVQKNEAEAWGLAVAFSLPAFWAWWRYRAASLRTDATGITQYGLFGKRYVAWNDVRDYYISGDDIATFGNIVGTQTKIRFWIGISQKEKLLGEVVRRTAPSCGGKSWKKQERS